MAARVLPRNERGYEGVSEEQFANNTATVVKFESGHCVKNERALRLAEEAGFGLKLYRPNTPKAKDKAAAKVMEGSRYLLLKSPRGPHVETVRVFGN